MRILLDNSHGLNLATPGKQSPVWPDIPRLLEWRWTREMVERIRDKLIQARIPTHRWEIHTGKDQTLSAVFARYFWNHAKTTLPTVTNMRSNHSDSDPDWDSNYAILRDTHCPSVLTQNLFIDNYEDCKFLLSEHGKATIADLHVNAIKQITQKLVHLSVHIVQALKTITIDSKVDDVIVAILTKLYPKFGSVVTTFMLRLEAWIPKWLEELHIAQTILDNKDKNDRLLAIITALNLSETRSTEYLQFAGKCLYYLDGGDDGKLDWEDCKAIVEEYYDVYLKK